MSAPAPSSPGPCLEHNGAGDDSPKTPAQLAHQAGLLPVYLHLAQSGERGLLQDLVNHLEQLAQAGALPEGQKMPLSYEDDLTIPRAGSELAAALGISRQRLHQLARQPGGGQWGIEALEVQLPGTNQRLLFRCKRPPQPSSAP